MSAACAPILDAAYARVGRTLREKWTLEGVRGVGGMATVYAARHRNGARVAIKMLHGALSASDEVRQRFAREAYISNLVDHPSVVRVLDDDVDPVDGAAFLVMDLVEGTPLDDARFAHFDDAKLLDVAEQVLEVLVAAHRKNVVHRDLKPENLLVQEDGRIRVLDFGIARALDDSFDAKLTRDGTTCGTPEFVAPEQALGRRALVSGKTDVYALGATLFLLASGEPVHGRGNPFELVIRAAQDDARSLGTLRPDLHARTLAIVDAATLREIEERPTAEKLLRAVRAARRVLGVRDRSFASLEELVDRSTEPPPSSTPIVVGLPMVAPDPIPLTARKRARVSTLRTLATLARRRTIRAALAAAAIIAIASAVQLARARRATTPAHAPPHPAATAERPPPSSRPPPKPKSKPSPRPIPVPTAKRY